LLVSGILGVGVCTSNGAVANLSVVVQVSTRNINEGGVHRANSHRAICSEKVVIADALILRKTVTVARASIRAFSRDKRYRKDKGCNRKCCEHLKERSQGEKNFYFVSVFKKIVV
jgi:hypothetical protein